jgi:hypothetical protein
LASGNDGDFCGFHRLIFRSTVRSSTAPVFP